MYHVTHFKEPDRAELLHWMRLYPFVTLCGTDTNGRPQATHIPVLVKEENGSVFLQGHLMRKQEHTQTFISNPAVLAIFHGPHAYVSASVYTDPAVASTWNYLVIHARGTISFKDQTFLIKLLKELTSHFENNIDSESLVEKMDPHYLEEHTKAIIGFEMEVESVEHVCKLSQNRNEESYDRIITFLQRKGGMDREVSELMQNRKHKVFK